MNELTFLVFIPIAGVIYLIGAALKAIGNEKLDKFIPVICGLCGGILGVVVFKTIPGYLPADNWLLALYVGIGSGLAAVGVNQIYKQFSKKKTLITTIEAFEELNGEYGNDPDELDETEREG